MDWRERGDNVGLLVRAGVVVAIVAVLLLASFLAGRGSAFSEVARSATPSPRPAAPAPWPGASRVVDGAPAGYAHTELGAVAAAGNDEAVLGGPLLLDPVSYRAAERALADPQAQARVLSKGEDRIAQLDRRLGVTGVVYGNDVVVRHTPLAYHVESYAGDRATLSVWAISVTGADGRVPPTQSWTTALVDLVWSGGDWRLSDESITVGPVPSLSQPVDSTTVLPQELISFHPYRATEPGPIGSA